MPFVDPESRKSLAPKSARDAISSGELAFQIYYLLKRHVLNRRLRFSTISECLGALAICLACFNDEVALPYESKKRGENGVIKSNEKD